MPQHIYQGLFVIWDSKKKKKPTGKGLILINKTGYYNIWINGTHYYYSQQEDVNSVNTNVLSGAFNSWKPNPRGIIVISRK